MPLTESWIQTALKVTGHFEDSADPLGGVSGDFDGMGISLGVLQWNVGMGSLPPLVKNAGRAAVLDAMPVFGGELWTACTSSISQGLAIVRGWQTGQRLRPAVKAELKAFTHGEAFVSQQIAAAHKVAEHAWSNASTWNAEAGRGEVSLQEFCWFFDLMTQNGGLKGISPNAVNEFITAAGLSRADDLVCDWLEARTEADHGFKDSLKNAQLWRDAVPEANLMLFVASYLRSQKSNLSWRADTLNRKGTIALGTGWVHGEKHELMALFDSSS
jgi:hypothetical protein